MMNHSNHLIKVYIFIHIHIYAYITLAIDLLKKLLKRNPKNRINAKDALNHPWITTKAADAP